MRDAPLDGVRCLDVARGIAGSYAACLLGDLGADVVKVEEPGTGDPLRATPPFLKGGESFAFVTFNRNKRGITLQLGHPTGRRIFTSLLEVSDVLIHSLRPAVLRMLGATRAALKGLRPQMITCSVTPFGASGPYSGTPGPELVIEAMGGFLRGAAAGGVPPGTAGLPLAEMAAGLHAALGITAAYTGREKEGACLDLEVSSLESLVALVGPAVQRVLATGQEPRTRTYEPSLAPGDLFPTQDRPIAVVATNDQAWGQICAATGLDDLQEDPRFATNADRVRNRKELIPILEEKFREREAAEWVEDLGERGVAVSEVSTFQGVAENPHLLERGLLTTMEHPIAGEVPMLRSPVRLEGEAEKAVRPAPLLGEHNGEILGRILGYSRPERERLRVEKII